MAISLAGIRAVFVLPMVILFLRSPREQKALVAMPVPVPTGMIVGLAVGQGFAAPTFYKLAMAALTSTFAGAALVLNIVRCFVGPVFPARGRQRSPALSGFRPSSARSSEAA